MIKILIWALTLLHVQAYWKLGAPPGMLLRVGTAEMEGLKNFFMKRLPFFMQLLKLPTELKFELFDWLGEDLMYKVEWNNIQYSEVIIDFERAHFGIEKNMFDDPVIVMDFPKVDNFRMHIQ